MEKNHLIKKGVILAGGSGKRMSPATKMINKQLLPVYDKPMIYYPLTTLILAGITEIAVVCNKSDLLNFQTLLGEGNNFGVKISYFYQEKPSGIVDAIKCCKEFWLYNSFVLILGDNLFYGSGLSRILKLNKYKKLTTVFGYRVSNPEDYGVIEFTPSMSVKNLIEKPKKTSSDVIATGLYFFSNDLHNYIENISKSIRGELEITDLLNLLAHKKKLKLEKLERGITWLDMGTIERYSLACNLIKSIQSTQGFLVGSPEEAAWRMGNINNSELKKICHHNTNKYFMKLSSLIPKK